MTSPTKVFIPPAATATEISALPVVPPGSSVYDSTAGKLKFTNDGSTFNGIASTADIVGVSLQSAYDAGSNINESANDPLRITGINGVSDPSSQEFFTPTDVDTQVVSILSSLGLDSAAQEVLYARIYSLIDGNTAGSHGGRMAFYVARNGVLEEFLRLDGQFGRISMLQSLDANSKSIYNVNDVQTSTETISSIAPSSLVATDIARNLIAAAGTYGISISGNSGTVTTNANLTGPITSIGNATTIAANSVTLANMDVMATAHILGRNTAATGNVESLTTATVKTMLNLSGTNSGDVSLAGQNYLVLAGQSLNAHPVNLSSSNVTGILVSTSFPALTGDVTNTSGTLATTVGKINGATVGTATPSSGNLLIGSGTSWVTNPITGAVAITASGVTTVPGRLLNIQNFNASGTYTPTAGTTSILVQVQGGGGAGGGSGTNATPGGNGSDGGICSFGALVSSNGGLGGNGGGANPGSGGLPGTAGITTINFDGNSGNNGSGTGTTGIGGNGGASPSFGGNGKGGSAGAATAGGNAIANSGSGGGGASGAGGGVSSAGGGAAGNFSLLLTTSVSVTVITIAAAATGGTAGASGVAGGKGGTGRVIIYEYS